MTRPCGTEFAEYGVAERAVQEIARAVQQEEQASLTASRDAQRDRIAQWRRVASAAADLMSCMAQQSAPQALPANFVTRMQYLQTNALAVANALEAGAYQ